MGSDGRECEGQGAGGSQQPGGNPSWGASDACMRVQGGDE